MPTLRIGTTFVSSEIFGIGYVVKTLGPQINDFVNTLLLNNQAANRST